MLVPPIRRWSGEQELAGRNGPDAGVAKETAYLLVVVTFATGN